MRNFKLEAFNKVIDAMKDTNEPDGGAVFEKTADVDFATFCAFVLTQWNNVTMETVKEDKAICYLFYNGAGATDHVASYIVNVPGYGGETHGHGVFGGSRVAANNAFNDTGVSYVKNAFVPREE